MTRDPYEQELNEIFMGNRPEQKAEREKIARWIKSHQERGRNYERNDQ